MTVLHWYIKRHIKRHIKRNLKVCYLLYQFSYTSSSRLSLQGDSRWLCSQEAMPSTSCSGEHPGPLSWVLRPCASCCCKPAQRQPLLARRQHRHQHPACRLPLAPQQASPQQASPRGANRKPAVLLVALPAVRLALESKARALVLLPAVLPTVLLVVLPLVLESVLESVLENKALALAPLPTVPLLQGDKLLAVQVASNNSRKPLLSL